MSSPVELALLWHFHQPDYRDPQTGRARLPWVRLHASKDYLDMAERLRRFPGVKATFNFVPVLLDQLEAAARGEPDDLFDQLAAPFTALEPEARRELVRRCGQVPRHAAERWPEQRRACAAGDVADAGALLAIQVGFLLAWLDPTYLSEPAAERVLAARGRLTPDHRDDLLALHARLVAAVVPAYRELADGGQAELSVSPYYHPILPLLVDLQTARRARPDLRLPREPFAAPDDAVLQLERALTRHRDVFGRPPAGVWPSEGSVAPEVAEIAAGLGVRWMATDEGVLGRSLPEGERGKGAIYRPWMLETRKGEVAFFFRDHELSDRIGFVYQRWDAKEAVADFVARLRRIGRDHAGDPPPLVSVILDGENCWEGYAADGGPFLDALYGALQDAPDIRTTTLSEALERWRDPPRLPTLHTGSWIDADLHVWIGHPEKNRAWDLLSRARKTLPVEGGKASAAREAVLRAEGSDWFWWFGDDHYTEDKALFDALFRAHLRAIYEASGQPPPLVLEVPVSEPAWTSGRREPPVGFIQPVVDGRSTHYYEWQAAGRLQIAGGAAMHAATRTVSQVLYGFDLEHFYLRLDFVAGPPDGRGLRIEVLEPCPRRFELASLASGSHPIQSVASGGGRAPVPGARCGIETVLELGIPLEALGWRPRDPVQLLIQILEDGQPVQTFPEGDAIRFDAPDESFDVSAWSP